MIKVIEDGKMIYIFNVGIDEFREEVCIYLKGFNIDYNKDEVCIIVGGSEGLYVVLFGLMNEGEKILILGLVYLVYENIFIMIGVDVVNYLLNDDFILNIEEIKEKLDKEDIKYLVLFFFLNFIGVILLKV